MSNVCTCTVYRPGEAPVEKHLDFEGVRAEIGGYAEPIYLNDGETVLIVREDALYFPDLPKNERATKIALQRSKVLIDRDGLRGTAVLAPEAILG